MMSPVFSPRSSPMPPVSTSVKGVPRHSASALTRSRVTPGWSCTIAILRPTMRLNRADLPTFGRPTIAIKPGMMFDLDPGLISAEPFKRATKQVIYVLFDFAFADLPSSLLQGMIFFHQEWSEYASRMVPFINDLIKHPGIRMLGRKA